MNKYILNIHTNVQTKKQEQILKNVSLSLINVATYCSEIVKKRILSFKDIEEIKLDKFIYTEFLQFYIHTLLNTADVIKITELQKIKLRLYLEKTISVYASAYFGENESESWKEQYSIDFIKTLHEKEKGYNPDNQSRNLITEFFFLSQFSKLAHNITAIIDKKEEKEIVLLFAYEVSTKEWAKMKPTEQLAKLKHFC